VAVASAGPYASLHLAQDRLPHQHPPLSFYRPDALPAAQPTASKHGRHKALKALLNNAIKIKKTPKNLSWAFDVLKGFFKPKNLGF